MMNKYGKALLASLLAVLLLVSAAGCQLVSVNEDKDLAQVVAKVGETEILKKEYVERFNAIHGMYKSVGYDLTATPEDLEFFQEYVLDELVGKELLRYKSREGGYDNLTDEQLKEIEDSIAEIDAEIMDQARTAAEAVHNEDPDIDVEAKTMEVYKTVTGDYIEEQMERDAFLAYLKTAHTDDYAAGNLQDAELKDVAVTDDELKAEFDQRLAADKEELTATPGDYKMQQEDAERTGGVEPLYVPSDYARVKCIKFMPETEMISDYNILLENMQKLQDEIGELSIENEAENAARIAEIRSDYATYKQQATDMRAAHFADSKAKAEDIYQQLQAGGDFDKLMKENTMDADFRDLEVFQQKGKLISMYATTGEDWSDQIKLEVFKLQEPGSFTGVLEEEDGFYILQYVGPETAGDRSFESVKEMIHEELLDTKREEKWNSLYQGWLDDESIVVRYLDKIRDVKA